MPSPGRQLEHDEAARPQPGFPVWLLAVDLDRPSNVGGLCRLADAFGVERLLFAGHGPDLAHPKAKRAARSTDTWVDHSSGVDALEILARAKAKGFEIVAVERTERSVDVARLGERPADPLVLVLGNERRGIPSAVLAQCSGAVHIPMYGRGSSMNVVQAASVAVHLGIQPFSRS